MEIKIKRVTKTAKLPTRGTAKSAGADLYADIQEPVTIAPGESYKFPSGIAFTAPEGYFGAIFARSGLSIKKGLRPSTCVSVIDEDYTDEVVLPLYNDSEVPVTVEPQERIAQVVFLPYIDMNFVEVDELEKTDRNGGIGSTGRF